MPIGGHFGQGPLSLFMDPRLLAAIAQDRRAVLPSPAIQPLLAQQQMPAPDVYAPNRQDMAQLAQQQQSLYGPLGQGQGGIMAKAFGPGKLDQIQAGLAMVEASRDPGYGGVRPGLGTALMAGIQQGRQNTVAYEQRQFEAGLETALKGGPGEAVKYAMSEGRFDVAQQILATQAAGQDTLKPMLVSKGARIYDPAKGEWIETPPDKVKPEDWKDTGEVDEEGKMILFRTNPESGQPEFVRGPTLKEEESGPTAKQRAEAEASYALATEMQGELTIMRGFVEKYPNGPTLLDENAPNFMRSDDYRQFVGAANNILSLVLKSRSGATATEEEVKRLKDFLIPQYGDDATTIQQKLARIAAAADAVQRGADALVATGVRTESVQTGGGGGGTTSTPSARERLNQIRSGRQ